MIPHSEMLAMVRRQLEHVQAGTTTMAEDQYRIPVWHYSDPERWSAEVEHIFRRKPLALAFTGELRERGSYKAADVCGVPVLMTRDEDGEVRAFLNRCSHRGSALVEAGCGVGQAFSCPYHGWTYDSAGALRSVTRDDHFGPVDKATAGLIQLPAAEVAGIVWVVLTPGYPLDIGTWLGDLRDRLDDLELAEYDVFESFSFEGPNWKVAMDGYLETYHFPFLHRNSFATFIVPHMLLVDAIGDHHQHLYSPRSVLELVDIPESDWDLEANLGLMYFVFPNLIMPLNPGGRINSNQVFPGGAPGTSVTWQRSLTRVPVQTPEQEIEMKAYSEMNYDIISGEDYWAGSQIQRGLQTMTDAQFVFGRNEPALHHFHESIEKHLAG